MRPSRFAALALFTFSLAVYLQTFGAVFHSIDEDIYLRMTRSLVERQTFAITPLEIASDFSVAQGLDGQMYANREPGFPVVAIPFYLLGEAMGSFGSGQTEPAPNGIDDPTVFTLSLTLANSIIGAAVVALMFQTLIRLGYGLRASTATALLLGFGSMFWSYASKSFFAEPLLALCTLAAFHFALRFRQEGSRLALVSAAVFVGWGTLTKVTAFATVPWLAVYAIWPDAGHPLRLRPTVTRLAWLAGGVAPFLLAWMVYNYFRFGNALVTGYELEGGPTPLTVGDPILFLLGLFGILLSPGKGLILYATPILLGIWAFRRFSRSHVPEAVFLYGASATTILGVALWRDWSGGWCWGPRLALDIVPLLLIPAVALISSARGLGRGGLWVIVGLALLSVVVQLVGVLPNYLNWYLTVGDYNLVYFSPADSPIIGHLLAISRGEIELFWDKTDLFFPGNGPLLAAARWVVGGIGCVAGGGLLWAVRRDTRVR
ncbi:MAG: phospholipid carrier-dependent glycosyltransferase [Dehalococcoidia bacterium]|nr:phospholipid carrier-dependent glycosyltransferase [Dehalococcoidia bacterium]